MKKKNGFTLVELIVSILLLSLVMMFMYNLLSDIKTDSKNDYFASDNQVERIEIIKTIENDLLKSKTVEADLDNPKICNGFKTINIKINDEIRYLMIKNEGTNSVIIQYASDSCTNIKRKWKLDNVTTNKNKINIDEQNDSKTLFQISIPIYTDNENNKDGNNNILDDIIIPYMTES